MAVGRSAVTRTALVLSVAFLLAVSVLAASAVAEPLAIVAAIKGRVEIVPAAGGPSVRAAFGRGLERGQRVVVAPGSSATIFFNDGNVIELAEKSSMTIGGRAAAKPRPGAAHGLSGDVYASVTRFVTGGSRETGLVALSTLRGSPDASPLLLEPRRTELLDPRPVFRWRGVEGALRYRIAVSGDQGELWSREVGDTALEYPTDAPPLPGGADVLWEVRALGSQAELRREETFVHVLAGADAEAVRTSLARIGDSAGGAEAPAALFLSGSYLSGRGLYHDAAARFDALSRVSPESPAPHEALGNVYRAVGLMDLAAAEYQRALTLTR
jgi:hypothetical protein